MIIDGLDFHNVVAKEYHPETKSYGLIRVPLDVRARLNDTAQQMASNTCGVEIRFFMESDEVKLKFLRRPGGDNMLTHGIAVIYQGDHQLSYELSNQIISSMTSEIVIKKSYLFDNSLKKLKQAFHPELIRVLLPYDWQHDYVGMEGSIRTPNVQDYPKKTLVCYGSSITHGGSSILSSNTYVFQLAQQLRMDYLNMGFAGSCHLDDAMAEYLRDLPWSILTLELGVNVLHWEDKVFESRVSKFLKTISQTSNTGKIYCIGLFRKDDDLQHNPKNASFRNILAAATKSFPQLTYLDGSTLLQDWRGLSIDGLHPAELGHTEIARKLLEVIK